MGGVVACDVKVGATSSSTMLEGCMLEGGSSSPFPSGSGSVGMYPLAVGVSRDGKIKTWQMLVTSVPL